MKKLLLLLLINTNIMFGASVIEDKYNPEINGPITPHFQKLEAPMAEHYSKSYKKYIQKLKCKIKEQIYSDIANENLLNIVNQYCCSYTQWIANNKRLIFNCKHGNIETIKELLESEEVDINVSLEGSTALIHAMRYNRKEIVELLLKYNASINTKDVSDNCTELMWAIPTSNKEIVELLLSYGANVNCIIKNFHNGTPLLLACYEGNKEIIDLLINADANIFSEDKYGRTVLDYAKISKKTQLYTEMKSLLKSQAQSKCCIIQ